MSDNIVETINVNGVTSTSGTCGLRRRLETPRSGDHVRWADGSLGRIWTLNEPYAPVGHAQVCENQGSAFLQGNGHHDISGGPFVVVALADLVPTYGRHFGLVWNWSDNMRGAGMAVEFMIPRPVFEYRGGDGPRSV